MQHQQFVYLLQEREFANKNENIYKIGKTTQGFKRYRQYPKESIVMLHLICDDCDVAEKNIIIYFDFKYENVKSIGREYYRGDFCEMIADIFKIVNVKKEHMRKTIAFNDDFICECFGNNDKNQIKETLNQMTIEDYCILIKKLNKYNHISKQVGNNIVLYECGNNKLWTVVDNCDAIFAQLTKFFSQLFFELDCGTNEYKILDKLKNKQMKENIFNVYKKECINNIIFDNKNLLCFKNGAHDIANNYFRNINNDDYVTTYCNFDWIEPLPDEIEEVSKLLKTLFLNDDEHNLFLQLMSLALGKINKSLIIMLTGSARCKKVVCDIIIKTLNEYILSPHDNILYNCDTMDNLKNLIGGKRIIMFRDLKKGKQIINPLDYNNNVIFIMETDKKIKFAQKMQHTDDILDISLFSNCNTTSEFQEKHKYALIKILMETHKQYTANNYVLDVPKSVQDRTTAYLELSCNIVQWFKDNYEMSPDPKDICKIKDIFVKFIESDYYQNLTKQEKRRYNKTFFVDYIESNIFLKKYYMLRYNIYTNVIKGWREKKNDDDE